MITTLIAAALAAVPAPIADPWQDLIAPCREAARRAGSDSQWLERFMRGRRMTRPQRDVQQYVCAIYLQGAIDARTGQLRVR